MIVDKNRYETIVEDVIKYSKNEVSENDLKQFQQHIEEKLENFEPTLMVYGTYNAGKSTLLNALFGIEEMAKTGDSPETAEVSEYKYNGYTIYDTPGINAPIEHENVTNEHLKKCEVILFVLSNDGSLEEEYVYTKISEIIKLNKPLLIVLNNKKNSDPNSKESIQEIDKVNINLSKIGDRAGIKNIEEKVSLCMVDVKTALEGKIEQEQELIDESNIVQLEKNIDKLLTEAGNKEVINALNLYIKSFINDVISKIDMKIDNPELQKVEELLTFLEKFKNKSEIELKNIIHKKMNILESGLRARLLNGSNEEEIHQYLENFLDTLISQIESKFETISSELKARIEQFSEDMNAINIDYEKVRLESSEEANEETSTVIEDTLKNALKNKELVTNVTKEALLKLREFKILFKGKWEKTLGKYAGKFAIVVNVLVGAYEIYQAISSHNKQVEAQRQHVLSAKNKSEEIIDSLKTDLFDSIDGVLNEVFDNLIKNFRKASDELNKNNVSLLGNKQKIQMTLNQLLT
ncbi:50S ribosome-binding GTPase [bacterium]|nr:50S ribosome-binding GTPase [bacterium]MBU1957796.1 50S ribosome-binding GTPase [bacterium]